MAMEYEPSMYEPNTAARLEQTVQQQLQSKSYDMASNKTLLKNYLVNSELVKVEVVCNVLVLALMRLPSRDFSILLSLLPPKCMDNKLVGVIVECAALLEKGKFSDFWEEYVTQQALFSRASGFVENIRLFILGTLRDAYRAMPQALFAQQLGLNENSLAPFCNGNTFIEKVAEDCVYFTAHEDRAAKVAPAAANTIRADEVSAADESCDMRMLTVQCMIIQGLSIIPLLGKQ
jgi:hypothetical protein